MTKSVRININIFSTTYIINLFYPGIIGDKTMDGTLIIMINLKSLEGGVGIGLLNTQIPKVLYSCLFIRWIKNFGYLPLLNFEFYKSFQMFQLMILILQKW